VSEANDKNAPEQPDLKPSDPDPPPAEKSPFDEQALARLLEAAYVLQEHNRAQQQRERTLERQNDELRQREEATQAAPGQTQAAPSSSSAHSSGQYTSTLAQIVKTQHQIQARHLDLEAVMALVAERAAEIEQASGAGIAILEQQTVCYRAGSGGSALPARTRLPLEKALSCACLRTGQAMRAGNVHAEFLLDAEECQRRGLQALLAVPVYHNGEIIGALEIYFAQVREFSEQDVHTGQLMAGLVTEAFARDAEAGWKKSLAAERASMLEALERLKPDLAALAESAQGGVVASTARALASEDAACWKCGQTLMAQEQFCGKCGSPRPIDGGTANLQSKLAALWNEQQENKATRAPASGHGNGAHSMDASSGHLPGHPDIPLALDPADLAMLQSGELAESGSANHLDAIDPFIDPELEKQIQKMVESLAAQDASKSTNEDPFLRADKTTSTAQLEAADGTHAQEEEEEVAEEHFSNESEQAPETSTALVKTEDDITWTSAAKAKDFFEHMADSRKQGPLANFWRSRRGDIYLAVAVILVAIVIRWGIWSNQSVGASGGPGSSATQGGRRRTAPDADLSFFDKMLISLNLAEAPEAPEYKGNPNAQVWVDLRSALYYCQGADQYGKTPKGKYTSQRDAQLDQFEPAFRKACD